MTICLDQHRKLSGTLVGQHGPAQSRFGSFREDRLNGIQCQVLSQSLPIYLMLQSFGPAK